MAGYFFRCEDCNQPDEAFAKNAKRCYICRLVRNLGFVRGRKAKCFMCDESFCPIARDDHLCGKCAFKTTGAQEVECHFCRETKYSISKDIGCCLTCARNPRYRLKLLHGMMQRQKERLEADPAPIPEPPEPPEREPAPVI